MVSEDYIGEGTLEERLLDYLGKFNSKEEISERKRKGRLYNIIKEPDSLIKYNEKKDLNYIIDKSLKNYDKIEYLDNIYTINSKLEENISKESYNSEKLYNSLDKIIDYYKDSGYEVVKKNIPGKHKNIVLPEDLPQVPQVERVPEVEITHEGLPAEYKPLLAALSQKHPGIRYSGMMTLADKSQHNVDILTFEYDENGEVKQLHVVAKDWDEKEEKIPAFLNSLGIKTHSVYERNTRLLIEHVGYQELRDVVRSGSESDIRKACENALDKISQIHVLASLHLDELEKEHGLVLDVTDYNAQFRSRFLEPVSGHSVVISPQMDKLMQAYSAFSRTFDPMNFVPGDFHIGNCRLAKEECFVVDYEWAKIGMKFDDLSRFTNSVLRDRPDLDVADFTREQLRTYVERHNEHASEHRSPLLMRNERLANVLRYTLVNDQIIKVGEKVAFANDHPKVASRKLEESRDCFEKAVCMIDGAMQIADAQGYNQDSKTLSNLRESLIDYVATSPVKLLKEAAQNYQTYKQYKEPVLVIPAA
ncbi:hypothetical protein KY342_00015 [Candidatus Woesearchaeota archaeon]|nr:hypothetical protein [Candidatus Woesearchaeota archaeon]